MGNEKDQGDRWNGVLRKSTEKKGKGNRGILHDKSSLEKKREPYRTQATMQVLGLVSLVGRKDEL